jgi:hypothetical protein
MRTAISPRLAIRILRSMILVFFLYAFNDAHILPEHCEFRLKVKRFHPFQLAGIVGARHDKIDVLINLS